MIVGSGIMFIAVTPKLGVLTFPEFVALAKSRPGQIAIGTNGASTLPHFSGLVLEKRAAFRSPWSQVVEGHTDRCDALRPDGPSNNRPKIDK
jgi:tripartite-type tricarboxylate transporter receptor subunit TctC